MFSFAGKHSFVRDIESRKVYIAHYGLEIVHINVNFVLQATCLSNVTMVSFM